MGVFYRYAGNVPSMYLQAVKASPARTIRAVRADLLRLIKAHQLPALQRGQAMGQLLTLGMAGRREWLVPAPGERSGRQRIVLLHWPTLLENCTRIQLLSPAVPLLLWLFRDVLVRRSPLLVELLQRKLPWGYQRFLSVDPVDMPEPLTPVEESLLSTYLKLASKDDALLKALQASFNATFDLATTKKSATSFAKDFDLNRHHVSTLFLDNISVVVSKFPKEVVLEGIDHPSFGPVSSNTLLKELMMAWHTRLNHDHPHYDELIKRMGVIYNSESRLLLVNFHRYLPYRRALSPALDEALPADVRAGDVDLATQARVLVRLYEDAYHSVVPVEGVGSYRNIYYGEGTAWDPEEWAGTLFVDVDAYRKIVAFAAKTELGRILGVPMATRRRASAQHMVATRTPKGFVDYYENPQTGEQLRFYVIRIGNHVYFSPPWEVPEEERFRPVRGYKGSGEKTRIRDDVKFVKLLKLWFYRYDFLMQQKGAPVGAIPGLRDWLYTWSMYDKDNFAALMRRKRKLVDTTRRRQQKDDLRGVRFTPEEDKVILDHYRPGMSFDDERIIFEVCGTRTPHAVSNRARFLCSQLLSAGVYDLNKLPHRRYNHRLITRIKKAVIENGDDLEKVLEDVRKARQIYLGVHRGSDGDAGEADGERADSSEAEAREEDQ